MTNSPVQGTLSEVPGRSANRKELKSPLWAWPKKTHAEACELLELGRVTIRGPQPSARLSEEICLSEGSAGVSEGSAGSLRGFCGVSAAGFCGDPRDFSEVFFQ